MSAWRSVFVFFFQAEDGIRDYKVTGVQTCALPIFHRLLQCVGGCRAGTVRPLAVGGESVLCRRTKRVSPELAEDRKSTRLNSSHLVISYAVFCLKKKKTLLVGAGRISAYLTHIIHC